MHPYDLGSPEHLKAMCDRWTGVLWDAVGNRVLPTTAAFDAENNRAMHEVTRLDDHQVDLKIDYIFTGLHFATDAKLGGIPIWHIPTVEWIADLVGFLRARRLRRVLEIGAGDGFLTQRLREAAPDWYEFIATDDHSWGDTFDIPDWVEKLDGEVAVDKYRPDLAIWVWPPHQSQEMARIILHPRCKLYLEVGESWNGCTGSDFVRKRFEHEVVEELWEHGRCRTDHNGIYHTDARLYPGAGNLRFKEFKVFQGQCSTERGDELQLDKKAKARRAGRRYARLHDLPIFRLNELTWRESFHRWGLSNAIAVNGNPFGITPVLFIDDDADRQKAVGVP